MAASRGSSVVTSSAKYAHSPSSEPFFVFLRILRGFDFDLETFWEGLMLTPGQIEFFHENGYVLMEDALSTEELAQARREMFQLLSAPEAARPGVSFSYEPEA